MFYIQLTSCISPQESFGIISLDILHESVDNKLIANEPKYDAIPPNILRRMSKAVRMGVGAALPILQNKLMPDGIIISTVNGGKEDCVKFLKQISDYKEEMLSPLNFVNSMPNSISSQIGLITKNLGYNITHAQQGLAFEYSMIDASNLLFENPRRTYLLGAVDDISSYNYSFETKRGCYKKETISNISLYGSISDGSIAGEAACMFIVSGNQKDAIAKVSALDIFYHDDPSIVSDRLANFISKHLPEGEKIDLLITGENGDNRILKYYESCELKMKEEVSIVRFKHMCGEYQTSSSMGLWLCCQIFDAQYIPIHMLKRAAVTKKKYKNAILYNNYHGVQHSFTLVSMNY
ncbi:MAG: beta-ketoacyl synthase chain length factor [Bacteroidetes bacterium]|nr:beta-ketoacyl synthase chain length factor [Bacteroidota bacterium]